MAIADSKEWRVTVSSNLPVLDAELESLDRKNSGMIYKILSKSVPNNFAGHTLRCYWGDIVPTNTDYPDTIAPIGSEYCQLIINSSGVVTGAVRYYKSAAGVWSVIGGGAQVAVKSSLYTLQANDFFIPLTSSAAAFTVVLPAAASWAGQEKVFKMLGTGTNAVTIQANAAETIDGSNTFATMDAQYDTIRIYSDGTDIHIISKTLA